MDIRYQATTGVPEWSPRGADAWRPFSSGCVDEILIIYTLGDAYYKAIYYNGTDFLYYDRTYFTTFDQSFFEQFDFCKSVSINYPKYDFTFAEGYYSFINFNTYTSEPILYPNLTVTHVNDGDPGSGYLSNWMVIIKYEQDPTQ